VKYGEEVEVELGSLFIRKTTLEKISSQYELGIAF
jgi:hypothetical protein